MHSILSYQILNATIIGQKSLSYFRHIYLSNKLSQSVATVYWKGTYVFVNDIGAHPLRGDLRLPLRGLLSLRASVMAAPLRTPGVWCHYRGAGDPCGGVYGPGTAGRRLALRRAAPLRGSVLVVRRRLPAGSHRHRPRATAPGAARWLRASARGDARRYDGGQRVIEMREDASFWRKHRLYERKHQRGENTR
jgi:hypothetical protein